MRLVVVGPVYPYRGGIAHHNSSLISALRAQGHEVLALSYKRQYPKFLYPGKSDKDPSNEKFEINSSFVLDPINPFTWKKGFNEISEFNPDKVVFHWWTSYWAPMYWYFLTLINRNHLETVAIVHNVYPHEQHFYDQFISKSILSRFDKLIVHSLQEREKLKKIIFKKEIYYFPHPIYDTLNIKLLDRNESKSKLLINSENRVFLMFGIIRKYKGLSVMLEAMKILVDSGHKNIQLIVAGEFWDSVEIYLHQIQDLKIGDYVTIENRYIPNEDIPLYFSAADLFVAPYIRGTQSGAIKLALAYNLPIVSTTIISDDLYDDEVYWRKVPLGDSNELAKVLKEFYPEKSNISEKIVSWSSFADFIKSN